MDIHGIGLQFSYIATYIHEKGGGDIELLLHTWEG